MTLKRRNHHQRHHEYDLEEDVEKIKAALMDAANDVRGKAGAMLSDSVDNMRERSELLKENLADYTGNKPFRSLGVAFLVGAIIGYLMHK